MTILLYRPSLDVTSGAGQLMLMQLRALRAAGERAEIGCERGALRFFLRSGTRARRVSTADARAARPGRLVVDHGLCVPAAAVTFVHNLATEAAAHAPRADWAGQVEADRRFFAELRGDVPLVANSRLVKNALATRFAVAPERIVVHHPGFDAALFNPRRAATLRAAARRELGVGTGSPLVGLITSGDFGKRGLDLFLESAERIAAARPDARFLVVGSKSLPAAARGHELVASGRLEHRPKRRDPARWFAALDLFLYPARFEEFGMVVLEAQAVGLAVVTSRAVGAAEVLPPVYERWLSDRPIPAELAERALELLADERARRELAAAGVASAAAHDERAYAAATVETILAQKRRLT
ncbi:MAG TPA: glycosyltransferase family 4 protein [Gammaproteobacteria bacterium]|nr:glycosyltransferase family 4 protein [Gammaproteobacteria bacterium]